MSDSIKFEFEAQSATVFGTIEYKYYQNAYSGNDPRAESKLKIDWKSIEITNIIFSEDIHPFFKSLGQDFEKQCKENKAFMKSFSLGILENNKDAFEQAIIDNVYKHIENN